MNRLLGLCAALSLFAVACGGAPKIPHDIDSTADQSCLGCHRDGTGGAPKTPHPSRSGCVSCHEQ